MRADHKRQSGGHEVAPDAKSRTAHEGPAPAADPAAPNDDRGDALSFFSVSTSEVRGDPSGGRTGSRGGPPRSGHTSVVYFHGVGEQRRFEEVSRLIDSLDQFAYEQDDSKALGKLRNIEVRLERPRGGLTSDVAFIRVDNTREDGSRPHNRFYEVYWAPVTAGGVPASTVARWLVDQLNIPLRTMFTPWRQIARLRTAHLRGLWPKFSAGKFRLLDLADVRACWRHREQIFGPGFRSPKSFWHKYSATPPRPLGDHDLAILLKALDTFEGPGMRRSYPKGRYRDFRAQVERDLAHSLPGDSKVRERLRMLRLVARWRRSFLLGEISRLAVLLSFAMALLLGVGAVAVGSLLLLGRLDAWGVKAWLDEHVHPGFGALLEARPENIATMTVAILSLLGVVGFLKKSLGDVLLWTTYRETDANFQKREAILQAGVKVLRHVLTDEECDRVVVVAHSLGTAVALDALLELGRMNFASRPAFPMDGELPLRRIEHLITLGSPIDKIHYFFETRPGRAHRFTRIYEKYRGDMGRPPFGRNRKPHAHWINFWDRADVISGPLQSPADARVVDLSVDNVEVSSGWFPWPARSHSYYFENPVVLEVLFRVIFDRAYSLVTLPSRAQTPGGYRSRRLGHHLGTGLRTTRPLQWLVLAVPWLVVAYVATRSAGLIHSPWWSAIFLVPSVLIILAALAATVSMPQHLPLPPTPEKHDSR